MFASLSVKICISHSFFYLRIGIFGCCGDASKTCHLKVASAHVTTHLISSVSVGNKNSSFLKLVFAGIKSMNKVFQVLMYHESFKTFPSLALIQKAGCLVDLILRHKE